MRKMNEVMHHAVFVLILDCCRFDSNNLTFTRLPMNAAVPTSPLFSPFGSLTNNNSDGLTTIFETGTSAADEEATADSNHQLITIFDFLRHPSNTEFFLVFSCDPGTVAIISKGERNSLFTGKLIECLQDSAHLSLEHLLHACTMKIAKAIQSGNGCAIQRPWYHSCLQQNVRLNI